MRAAPKLHDGCSFAYDTAMAEPNVPAAPAPNPSQGPTLPANSRPNQPESSVKETIESILIAFILAFMFRAFVVEAFVIPTGSMATTLMGAHMRFRCPDCGYTFDVNYMSQGPGDDISIPSNAGPVLREEGPRRYEWVDKDYDIRCPNCGYHFPLDDRFGLDADARNPPVRYGDRILVLKYLYLFEQPKRWDVVVFKSPADPEKYHYEQNYIKRLVGEPGESICILDGDVYTGTGDDITKFKIQTKPRYAQEALWRNVYDNDYFPLGLTRGGEKWQQPWVVRSGTGWSGPRGGAVSTDVSVTHKQQRVFTFDNLSGSSTLHFDPNANATDAFTDYLAYDQGGPASRIHAVSDLKLDFFYQRKAGDGPLRLSLSKNDDTFIAELTPGHARLIRAQRDGSHEVVLAERDLPKTAEPVEVDFSNHDYQVALRVGDKDVFVTTPEQYHPDIKQLLADFYAHRPPTAPSVEISAANQRSVFSHLKLSRDIYYLNRDPRREALAATPDDIMHLGKDEFFVMGDNSAESFDARYWQDPINLPWYDLKVGPGRVPERFMLGKAFFVYWPAGFRPFSGAPPLAPDFGEMRFIR